MEFNWSFILTPWFQFFLLPILTTLLSIGVKIVARKSKAEGIPTRREDIFIGLELGMTACLILVFEAIRKYKVIAANPDKVSELFPTFVLVVLALAGLGLILFGVAYIISRKGWNANSNGEFVLTDNTIIWTDIMGVVYLIIVSLILSE